MSMKFDSVFGFAAGASKMEDAMPSHFPITPEDGALELSDFSALNSAAFDADPMQLVTPLTDTISPQDLLSQAGEMMDSPLFDAPIDDPNEWAPLFGPAPYSELGMQPSKESEAFSKADLSDTAEVKVEVPKVTDSSVRVNKGRGSVLAKLSSDAIAVVGKKQFTEISNDIDAKKDELGLTIYNRKPRSLPLSPIVVDEGGDGTVATKRARNTEAARRSRARKMERMIQLEELVRDLAEKNARLTKEVTAYQKLYGDLPSE